MTNRWLLPDHIADVLPTQARQIEETRRALLDTASRYGFELVMPPLVEHLDSLLIGAGAGAGGALDLQTFKLVDQTSGRTLGVRADTTPQVARIDAHLLNRQGLTRLCYCGPVLHTVPATPHATREPLQFGAEVYGHTGLEADLEIIQLAIHSLQVGGVPACLVDLSNVCIAEALLDAASGVVASDKANIYAALASKDSAALAAFPDLLTLLSLYGGREVLDMARAKLPKTTAITAALDSLQWLVKHLIASGIPADAIRFDLADLGGYGYYSGIRFALYSPAAKDALARGGRYDEVGAVFGRKRPAVGFSLDIKALVESAKPHAPKAAIRAPWGVDAALVKAVRDLRASGEVVMCILPGHESEADEFACDRELVLLLGEWQINPLVIPANAGIHER